MLFIGEKTKFNSLQTNTLSMRSIPCEQLTTYTFHLSYNVVHYKLIIRYLYKSIENPLMQANEVIMEIDKSPSIRV